MALLVTAAWGASASAECSADSWSECAGAPWVDQDVMGTPQGSKWWPHPLWGEGDEAGSTNWYTEPEVVMRALAQIDEGKAMQTGHDDVGGMPLFREQGFSLRIPGTPTGGAFGANRIMWNDEFLSTEIGRIGTQIDGHVYLAAEQSELSVGPNLPHLVQGYALRPPNVAASRLAYNPKKVRDVLRKKGLLLDESEDTGVLHASWQRSREGLPGYPETDWRKGFTAQQSGNPYGLNHLGGEKLHPIIARGILLDIAAVRDTPMEKVDVVTMADVNAALAAQGMADYEPMAGDAILNRTGWERHWENAPTYNDGCPGIGMEVARWIAETVQAGVTGFDTWPGDAVPNPNPDPACAFCVHTYLQTRHGIVNQENLKLSVLADAGVYQFAYFYSPVPVKGATGSIGSPVALW